MLMDSDSVLEQAAEWQADGRRVVLATVVSTWRSSPRPVGSQMAVADDGRFAGSVSGGCVEAAVIQRAGAMFDKGGPGVTLKFGVTTRDAWEVGLPCGGQIEVFVAAAAPEFVAALVRARRERQPAAAVLDLERGVQRLLADARADASAPEGLGERAARALADETSQLVEAGDRRFFVQVASAPPRLVVVGAVHLTQALGELAERCGFEVIVVDPRTAFASEARFPRARLIHDWPDEAIQALAPDARTAVVVLSHDAKLDEPALAAALASSAFYVGALGSSRTQAARKKRLAELGIAPEQLSRIRGPVGLDIGALTTAEIAVAIMAEIIGMRRRGEAFVTSGR